MTDPTYHGQECWDEPRRSHERLHCRYLKYSAARESHISVENASATGGPSNCLRCLALALNRPRRTSPDLIRRGEQKDILDPSPWVVRRKSRCIAIRGTPDTGNGAKTEDIINSQLLAPLRNLRPDHWIRNQWSPFVNPDLLLPRKSHLDWRG